MSVKAVRGDRHVGSGQSSKDAMSRLAQRKHGFRVRRLPGCMPSNGRPTLLNCEDHRTPLPDAVAFRIDFSDWCDRFNDRKRKVLLALAEGSAAWEVAERFGLSEGRISQLRREYESSWQRMQANCTKMPRLSPE